MHSLAAPEITELVTAQGCSLDDDAALVPGATLFPMRLADGERLDFMPPTLLASRSQRDSVP